MEIFHVLNRGVDKRNITKDKADKLRFMQGLYLYNNKSILDNNVRRKTTVSVMANKHQPLVHIYAFCLMSNHYHILLSPVNNDLANLSAFMRKLNMGYAKYFNKKYDRVGALWQGKYKKIHVNNDAHFNYIPYYIHLNPLDIKFPEWREGGIRNTQQAIQFLMDYKWSSFQDYNDIKNYPSVINTKLLSHTLGNKVNQQQEIISIIQNSTKASYSEMIE